MDNHASLHVRAGFGAVDDWWTTGGRRGRSSDAVTLVSRAPRALLHSSSAGDTDVDPSGERVHSSAIPISTGRQSMHASRYRAGCAAISARDRPPGDSGASQLTQRGVSGCTYPPCGTLSGTQPIRICRESSRSRQSGHSRNRATASSSPHCSHIRVMTRASRSLNGSRQ